MKIVGATPYYSGHDRMVNVEINMSKNEYSQFSELVEEKFTSTNTARDEFAVDLLRGIMAQTLFSAESQSSIVSEFQRQLSPVA